MMRPYNILFMCTGNSARSILGEVLATTLSHGRFIGYSAGSQPKKFVHPIALKLAREMGYPLELLRSKTWDEFGSVAAPHMVLLLLYVTQQQGRSAHTGLVTLQLHTGVSWIQQLMQLMNKPCGMLLEKWSLAYEIVSNYCLICRLIS